MIKCPFCTTKHVINTVFCNECGQFLLEDGSIPTEKFPTIEAVQNPTKWRSPHATPQVIDIRTETSVRKQSSPLSPLICLRIGPQKREVQFRLDQSVCIGRLDPGKDIFPDIDLTKENKETKVVSRRHIRMFTNGKSVMVEDLDSLNGTFLNGERLPPYLSVAVSDGDCLMLGTLQMEVGFLPE